MFAADSDSVFLFAWFECCGGYYALWLIFYFLWYCIRELLLALYEVFGTGMVYGGF